MKTVYHIHQTMPGIYENKGISKGFKEAGYKVFEIDWAAVKQRKGSRHLRDTIIRDVYRLQPDLIFAQVQVAGVIDEPTIEAVMKVCPMVMFNLDARDEEESTWMYQLNHRLTHFFYSNQHDVCQANLAGAMNASVLQSSCDHEQYYITGKIDPLVPEIVFIGNRSSRYPLSQQRTEMVMELRGEFGPKFKAYGLGFSEGFIYPQREIEIYNSARICIVQNHFDYPEYQSDRLWRIMACGGRALAYSPDLVSKINEILIVDHDMRFRSTAQEFNRKLFLKNFTYKHRVLQIEKIIGL